MARIAEADDAAFLPSGRPRCVVAGELALPEAFEADDAAVEAEEV